MCSTGKTFEILLCVLTEIGSTLGMSVLLRKFDASKNVRCRRLKWKLISYAKERVE